MYSIQDEFKCQGEALKIISHNNNDTAMKLYMYHKGEIFEKFRMLINEFEKDLDRVPTADELIWLTSERLHKNIRELFE